MNATPVESPPVTISTLAAGTGAPILLVDFVRFSATGTLSKLLAGNAGGRTVVRIDAVSDLSQTPRFHRLDELAAAYAAALLRRDEAPAAIVGFCSASSLALWVADRMALAGQSAPVVLVEPTWPTRRTIEVDLKNMRASVRGGHAPTQTLPSAEAAECFAFMSDLLRADLAAMAAEQEISAEEAEAFTAEMLSRYRAWLAFVLATADDPAAPEPDYVIVSTEAEPAPAQGWAGKRPLTIRVPAPSGELFADDKVCRELLAIVAREGDRR